MGDLLWKAYAKKWMPISGLLCYPVLNQAKSFGLESAREALENLSHKSKLSDQDYGESIL